MSIEQIWLCINNGEVVYWKNTSYQVVAKSSIVGNQFQQRHFSFRDNKILCVRCVSNGFGSILDMEDLQSTFLKKA